MEVQQINDNKKKELLISRIGAEYDVNVRVKPLYSTEKECIRTALVAASLVDIAMYQLCEVVSNNGTIKKCANPSCGNYIVGGRRDKRTCSDACRQAVSRAERAKAKSRKEN